MTDSEKLKLHDILKHSTSRVELELVSMIEGLTTRLEAAEKEAELWKDHALMLGTQTDVTVKELSEYVEVLEAKLASVENKGN